jgi:hypothetical protein
MRVRPGTARLNHIIRTGFALAIWFAKAFAVLGTEISAYSLRWNTHSNQTIVEASGISGAALGELRRSSWQLEDWQKLLSVKVDNGDPVAATNFPAILGQYRITNNAVQFEPKFPIESGVKYRAVFRPLNLPGAAVNPTAEVASTFQLSPANGRPATVVTEVYPSGHLLPENLLKFYVYFSAPMRRGNVYDHIQLIDDSGLAVELPFLEIQQELWNPELTRLTLFIDPGRIKRGVQPLEVIGPVLVPGRDYELVIDHGWQDAQGNPLKQDYRKSFKAGPPIREPLTPAGWTVTSPAAQSLKAVEVRFAVAMDHALARRMIWVSDRDGNLVPGEANLSEEERQWQFTPAKPWKSGEYRIMVETSIEDMAGNNIGKPFEVDLFEGVEQRFSNSTVSLAFKVQ